VIFTSDSLSVAFKVTVTLLTYQPFSPSGSGGLKDIVVTGGVVSSRLLESPVIGLTAIATNKRIIPIANHFLFIDLPQIGL
jgi:hypothetical protein